MTGINVNAHIARPVDEVFAYLTDLRTVPLWDRGVRSIEIESGGPLRVGARVHEVRSMMGRTVHAIMEITVYDPPRTVGFRGDAPFPMHGGYRLAPDAGGTDFEFHGEAELHGLFGLLEPLIRRVFAAQMRARFAALKVILEASQSATLHP